MISTNQFKSGMAIIVDGEIFQIVEYQHVKPGKGGAFVRTKLKNLRTYKTLDKTFRPDEKFTEAYIEEKKLQYLYNSQNTYHFMDQETYDEVSFDKDKLGAILGLLKDNMIVVAIYCKNEILEINLPMFIELEIKATEPGFKGDTAKNSFKPATLETGATIQVPLFVNENDKIKIDTRTCSYVERV